MQILLLSHATDILGGPGLLPVMRVFARIGFISFAIMSLTSSLSNSHTPQVPISVILLVWVKHAARLVASSANVPLCRLLFCGATYDINTKFYRFGSNRVSYAYILFNVCHRSSGVASLLFFLRYTPPNQNFHITYVFRLILSWIIVW